MSNPASLVETEEIVCLVDDDPSLLRSVGRLLESAGFRVRSFVEPRTFLDYLATHEVPVVVLDIWMKQMSGLDLLGHLGASSPDSRVIFLTAEEDPAAERAVLKAGAFAFFTKPFDAEQLLNAVRRGFTAG